MTILMANLEIDLTMLQDGKFISENLFFINGFDIKGKSIIVLDDQLTSSATAYEISSQLRQNGAKNILFIALFYLILHIESKACPKCGKTFKD